MSIPAAQRITVAATALAAAVLLAGCSSQPGPTATKTITATASPTATPNISPASSAPTVAASSSATSSATAAAGRTDPNAPKGQCADSALTVSVKYDPDGAGAGQRSSWVIFRNTGTTSCVLAGAPGVSLVGNNNGTQLGQPADRTGDTAAPVTIPAGSYAGALLNYTYVDKTGGNFNTGTAPHPSDPACKAAPADGYRIYPPHSYQAFFDRSPTYACTTNQRWIHIGPVQPAAKVNVTP